MDSLHIYAQQQCHDSCHIVGTWSELAKLREAINRAIESQQVASELHTSGVPSTGGAWWLTVWATSRSTASQENRIRSSGWCCGIRARRSPGHRR